jgi:ABC-type sulfate transport system substrate-binding protein
MVAEPTVLQKRCTKCRVTKAASEFFRFKFSSDGLQSYCKVTARPVDPLVLARIPYSYVSPSVRMLHYDNGTCVNWNLFEYTMKGCC